MYKDHYVLKDSLMRFSRWNQDAGKVPVVWLFSETVGLQSVYSDRWPLTLKEGGRSLRSDYLMLRLCQRCVPQAGAIPELRVPHKQWIPTASIMLELYAAHKQGIPAARLKSELQVPHKQCIQPASTVLGLYVPHKKCIPGARKVPRLRAPKKRCTFKTGTL